jgi:hypothetical protein
MAELMARMVQESWSITMVRYGRALYTLRINTSFSAPGSRSDYFYQVSIVVPFQSKTHNGFPGKQEDKSLTVIEEILLNNFREKHNTVLVGVVTGNNLREFLLYTSAPSDLEEHLAKALRNIHYKYRLTIQEDRDWSVYESFYGK